MLRNINIEDSLSESHKEKLSTLLLKYQAHFTKKTREKQLIRISIPVARWNAKVPNSRPIPFASHKEVQEQVEEMLAYHITEESYSSYVNPLTLVQRDGKHIRMSWRLGSQHVYDAGQGQVASNANAVAEISWGYLHLDPGFKQRLFANTIGRILKEMDSFPVPQQGVPIYTSTLWFPKLSHCFIRAFQLVCGGWGVPAPANTRFIM